MRLRATHGVLPAYLLGALLFTWPLPLAASRAIPATGIVPDPYVQAFLLGWDWHALRTAALGIFHPPIFHPETNVLTYMDHMIGETLLASPWLALSPSVAPGYDFLVWLSFAASGWAVYRLARLFAVSRGAAFLAGFLFAFSPYRFANLDQLNILQTEFLPLALWFAIRWLRRYRLRDFAGLAASCLGQLYCGWYYTFYLAGALILLAAYAAARRELRWRAALAAGPLAVAAACVLAALPVALPYLAQQRAMPEYRRTLHEVELYSASPVDYLRINARAAAARWLPADRIDQAYWPGLVTVGLAAVGLGAVAARRRRAGSGAGYFILLGAAAAVLSLGPHLHAGGWRVGVPLPYAALYRWVPGIPSMRAPDRLAVLVLLAAAVLAAVGYEALRARWGGRPRRWNWIAGGMAGAALVLAWQQPLFTLALPTAADLPPVYAWLARQPGREPLLELPASAEETDESPLDVLRQYYVLFHGKPRLDGSSGFVSPRYRHFRVAMRRFPEPAALAEARTLGARWVVVHLGDYPEPARAALAADLGAAGALRPVARFGDDAVFRLAAAPASP